jgi:Ca2+-binding EF-hand superfamily protein
MLTPKFVAASIVAFGLAGAPAFAQDAMRADADTQFQQLDRSNKGYLTPADVSGQPTVAQRFAKFDANRDGRLDRSEFAALIASVK